jgi:hypothetical protein
MVAELMVVVELGPNDEAITKLESPSARRARPP